MFALYSLGLRLPSQPAATAHRCPGKHTKHSFDPVHHTPKTSTQKLDTFFKTERRRRRVIGTTKTPSDTPPPYKHLYQQLGHERHTLLENRYSRAAHRGHHAIEPHTTLAPAPATKTREAVTTNADGRTKDYSRRITSLRRPTSPPSFSPSFRADIPALHPYTLPACTICDRKREEQRFSQSAMTTGGGSAAFQPISNDEEGSGSPRQTAVQGGPTEPPPHFPRNRETPNPTTSPPCDKKPNPMEPRPSTGCNSYPHPPPVWRALEMGRAVAVETAQPFQAGA